MEKQNHFEWISKIIKSCNNDFHFSCVDRLIELYLQKHCDEDSAYELACERTCQWNSIHSILT